MKHGNIGIEWVQNSLGLMYNIRKKLIQKHAQHEQIYKIMNNGAYA